MIKYKKQTTIGGLALSLESTPNLGLDLSEIDKFSREKLYDYLSSLQNYECWSKYCYVMDHLVSSNLMSIETLKLSVYSFCMYLDDLDKAVEISSICISKLKIDFKSFLKRVVEPLAELLDYKSISYICEGVYLSFVSKDSSTHCLEYLCFIYEKKLFNDKKLNTSYARLLEMDPQNIRALTYFKVLYSENRQWRKVTDILERLYTASRHPTDKYKFALELASTFVYQLDEPKKAVEIIESRCIDSPINSLAVHYDAYYRCRDWKGCLTVLQKSLDDGDRSVNRSIILYKMGELEEILGNNSRAEGFYLSSAESDVRLLEPIESLVEMYTHQENWPKLQKALLMLLSRVSSAKNKERLQEALDRLALCL